VSATAFAKWLARMRRAAVSGDVLSSRLGVEIQGILREDRVIFLKNTEVDCTFFREILGFKSVGAGHGWLILALPPRKPRFIRPTAVELEF
jgi:hypothetical protein